ncbi:uncharacterized protein LOC111310138 [Durio zibethinus]|uniref:Uncharacterized protein LOC111310138 n=1 Tax=Durio zibethinus TaxID=66656 RepID=A0A6P6AJP7_DURZI|nr:uncharacterized protein LOC111310138 [Durio zibethinus]XP_022765030.1 uncharacterized protein LOC111310138 [Durio zibethinus]XP_022765031.1 uncharacterized protein LOC111310138 [Durio zibethinus]
MELNFATKTLQMPMLKIPQESASLISSVWFATPGGCSSQPLAYCWVHPSATLFSSRKFKGHNLKLARCARCYDFSHGELSKQIEGEVQPFEDTNTNDVENNYEKGCQKVIKMNSSMQLLPSKVEFPDPSLLGIWPDTPDWPERDEIHRIRIEQKANSFGIPLSLRIIKRKQRWKEGFVDAGEFAYCSVKKAVSSLVFIIRELQNHALVIREGLYCEDLLEIMTKMQRDMNLTFVWLFQQVFSKTPTLMVYVMLLLANFSVHSMTDNVLVDATQPRFAQKTMPATMSILEEESEEYPNAVADEIAESSFLEKVDDEELDLWKSMVEEASRMRGELYYKVLDHKIRQQLVSPLHVQLEPDNYEMHLRTNLIYQMFVTEEPNNPLLLSNYAQFLSLVFKDHDRAEECFKRAIQAEPQDAEALGLYADFLWQVRNDHWEAEERYLQAVAADPQNPFHASKYANFLWSTGGEGTCFPLSSSSYDTDNKIS